jgi:hypothetical protein
MPRGIRPERVTYAAAGVILLEFKKVPDILRAESRCSASPGGWRRRQVRGGPEGQAG